MSERTFSKEDTKIIGFVTDGDRRLNGVYPLVFRSGTVVYTGCVTENAVLAGKVFFRSAFIESVEKGSIALLKPRWSVTTDAVAFGFSDGLFPPLDIPIQFETVLRFDGLICMLELKNTHHIFYQAMQKMSESNAVGLQEICAALLVCNCLVRRELARIRFLARAVKNKLRSDESYEAMKLNMERYAKRLELELPAID